MGSPPMEGNSVIESNHYRHAIRRMKTALYGFVAIFMQDIPLKTEGCLTGGIFLLFRNRQIKITKPCSALIFVLFLSRKRGRKIFVKKKGVEGYRKKWFLFVATFLGYVCYVIETEKR